MPARRCVPLSFTFTLFDCVVFWSAYSGERSIFWSNFPTENQMTISPFGLHRSTLLEFSTLWEYSFAEVYRYRRGIDLSGVCSVPRLRYHCEQVLFFAKGPGWSVHAISMPNHPFIQTTKMDIHVSKLYPQTMDVLSGIFKWMDFSACILPWTLHGYSNLHWGKWVSNVN